VPTSPAFAREVQSALRGGAVNRRYVLVSPVRDEAEFARRTLDSVTQQSVPPALWVIVDDGSTDGTSEILADYARRFPYIRVHRRQNRGVRSVGPGVIEAFYDGYDTIQDLSSFAYLCKLDLDLDMPPRYFEILIERMEAEPRLGTYSGKPYFPGPGNAAKDWAGELIAENCGDEMSVGMTKFYRVECFQEIGGFVRQVMWDGIDCHRCRMLGWLAASGDDPELRFIHLRPMGSSHKGIITGRKRHGFGQYFMGTSLPYMTASALFRATRPPLLVGGAAMWWGYVESLLEGKERFGDEEFRRFLRAYQRDCLLLGKKRATLQLNARQAERWRQGRPKAQSPADSPATAP
jgi:biofilm PGA synthesis N-glycosyltransferase PgaC